MKVSDIAIELEMLAPAFLKEDYDNVGLMVGDYEKNVKKVLLALDCTKEVIKEAKENKVDLIITHHPLIFRKPSRITREDLQGFKIIELIKNDISLFSSHTNLDVVEGGINEEIVKILGFNRSEIIDSVKIPGFEGAGIGRIVELVKETTLNEIIELVKEKLETPKLRVVDANNSIKKVAIINGSGQDYFEKAYQMGADCIITGDTTYHYVSDYKEKGISIIDAGHFNTEFITFLKVMKKIEDKFKDIEFIHSKVNKDPYKFV